MSTFYILEDYPWAGVIALTYEGKILRNLSYNCIDVKLMSSFSQALQLLAILVSRCLMLLAKSLY